MKKDELKKYDGTNGNPAYVAYKGKIYDVTESRLWKKGSHVNRHNAGDDLTDFMSMAPHADDVMAKFKVVAELEAEEDVEVELDKKDILREWYRKYHPHPVLLHFPMGLFYFSALMQLMFLVFRNDSFETAAYYSLIGGTLSSIPATISGIFSWWLNYQLMLTSIFKIKLINSIILIFIGITAILIRFYIPEVSSDTQLYGILYNGLVFISVPILTIVAYNGGKITWPS